MPGAPLTKITKNLETAGWPYDPAAAANAKWSMIPTTPAPKAVFDASQGHSLQSSGILRTTQNDVDGKYPIELTPEGSSAYRIKYPATTNPLTRTGPDKKIQHEVLRPNTENWHYFKIRQPDNFKVKRHALLQITDASEVSGWQVGDTVSNGSGATAIFHYVGVDDGKTYVVLDEYGGGHPENSWSTGKTITNQRTSTSFSPIEGKGTLGNSKFIAAWVDDFTGNYGYENAAFHLGFANSISDPSGANGLVYTTGSRNTDDPQTMNGFSFTSNELVGEPEHPALFDAADNGFDVEIIAHFKRSTGPSTNDAEIDVYKKVHRVGSPHEQWTHIFRDSGLDVYSAFSDNNFTCQYIFGNKNHNYEVDTIFYMYKYEYWLQKHEILTSEGL